MTPGSPERSRAFWPRGRKRDFNSQLNFHGEAKASMAMNLRSNGGDRKAPAGISNSDDDDLLTLEGLVVSSRDLSEDRKIDLLRFLSSLRGAVPSWDALRFALRVGKEEGVW
jgi:hypothetical protein